jgi:ATP-dependent Zn protease
MKRKKLIAQIYGYAVCLVAVITFLISIISFTNALFDLSDPEFAGYRSDVNLSSFENFKTDAMKSVEKEAAYIPDDATLQKMFNDAKMNKAKIVRHNAKKTILVTSLTILLSIALFIGHWIWLRSISKKNKS